MTCRVAGALTVGELLWPAAAGADVPGVGIITGPISSLLGGAAGWAFDQIAEGIAHWVLGAVAYFVNGAIGFLTTSARPDVEAAWFAGPGSPYATVRNIAGVLLVGFVFLGLLQGLLNGDAAGMVRRVCGNLPAAVAGMILTTAVAGRLLELTDVLSAAVLSTSDQQAMHFLSGFGVTVTSLTSGFAAVLLGLVAVLAALVLWVELIVRSSLVYLLVAISPLGFAATLWPAAKGMLRRTVELLLAVILSKFFIAITLAIGVAALSGAGTAAPDGGPGDQAAAGLGTLLIGAVLLGLAAFAPFLVLKLIPMAEGALIAHGISRAPVRAAQTGAVGLNSARGLSRISGSGQAAYRSGQAAGAGGSPVPSAGATQGMAASGGRGAAVAGPAVAAAAVGAAAVGKVGATVRGAADPKGDRAASPSTSPNAPARQADRAADVAGGDW
jgi:hypothetical protein